MYFSVRFGLDEGDIIHLKDNEFLMPGLIDSHIHAPQFVNAGKAGVKGIIKPRR